MLAAVGIRSRLVLVYSGDRNYVRSEWPSPQQFNHGIIAVSVGPDVRRAGVLDESGAGRVLFFDPTDEFTPVGSLPLHEQGSHALIVGAADGVLVRLPSSPETAHAVVRTVDAEVTASGAFAASVVERLIADRAAQRRAVSATLDEAQYRDLIERRVAAVVQGGRVVELAAPTIPARRSSSG